MLAFVYRCKLLKQNLLVPVIFFQVIPDPLYSIELNKICCK